MSMCLFQIFISLNGLKFSNIQLDCAGVKKDCIGLSQLPCGATYNDSCKACLKLNVAKFCPECRCLARSAAVKCGKCKANLKRSYKFKQSEVETMDLTSRIDTTVEWVRTQSYTIIKHL